MKTELGAVNCLYPLPTTLVGAHVKGKPNFITIAHVGIMDLGSLSLGMNKVHYTNDGIKENGAFSVNIPSMAMVKETDYCGIVSGKKRDKSVLFDVFYGELQTALQQFDLFVHRPLLSNSFTSLQELARGLGHLSGSLVVLGNQRGVLI